MQLAVVRVGLGHRLDGDDPFTDVVNRFLAHLEIRGFAAGTIRVYAYDLLNFGRFLAARRVTLGDIVPTDLLDYLDWQSKKGPARRGNIVPFAERRGPAPATMNRRIAAVRGLFEYAVIAGVRAD